MYLDHKHGFMGFSSEYGSTLFGSKHVKWSAFEVFFKHKSEHKVDFQRYDAEIQILHTPLQVQEDLRRRLGRKL